MKHALLAKCALLIAPILKGQGSLSQTLEPMLSNLDPSERGLAHQLILGTFRQGPRLERIAQQLLDKPLKEKDKDVYALILLGLYQLDFMRTADHAAINNTVDATLSLKKSWAKALVNGVLRNYQRDQAKIFETLDNDICFHSAFPGWLAKRVKKFWPEQKEAVYQASNSQPAVTLRVNPLKSSIEEYADQLTQTGIEFQRSDQTGFITLNQAVDITQLPGFDDGTFSVQDSAAQFASQLIELESNQRVLDACCAPGGKTCAMLEAEPELASMVAIDLEADRLKRVEQNLSRLNLSAELIAGDVSQTESWWDGQPFDRILLDAPCSATGVVRRHPDIKYLRRPEDINALADTQLQLLLALWPLLKKGGTLLYATCSILPTENEQVIDRFLKQSNDATSVPLQLPIGFAQEHGWQFLPEQHSETTAGHDGFYYAKLVKD
ncbi:16S rRNA (cytosine(967)-C(5))-methyltransferase RsmB [Litoribrevibacter albus]|uniref:16S rRNA (cytosine(967)-C(5))-methyltransferase n=1 Tax=Litoribrevibacter albus TaxID=1473156 RepID=A0AA37SBC2_9GAMM|nr:16S rRNA (cytosine(967)-C(5))-methyltransferase RsmB [Litoribrevibacter albus]GLQ32932.1 ribosomal RNA small subunit methyltransferase B [Litoribrevibacter albus]